MTKVMPFFGVFVVIFNVFGVYFIVSFNKLPNLLFWLEIAVC